MEIRCDRLGSASTSAGGWVPIQCVRWSCHWKLPSVAIVSHSGSAEGSACAGSSASPVTVRFRYVAGLRELR